MTPEGAGRGQQVLGSGDPLCLGSEKGSREWNQALRGEKLVPQHSHVPPPVLTGELLEHQRDETRLYRGRSSRIRADVSPKTAQTRGEGSKVFRKQKAKRTEQNKKGNLSIFETLPSENIYKRRKNRAFSDSTNFPNGSPADPQYGKGRTL